MQKISRQMLKQLGPSSGSRVLEAENGFSYDEFKREYASQYEKVKKNYSSPRSRDN